LTNIIGISGWSGSGKTKLITNLIKFFKDNYNLKVCALKHAHHTFELDQKGKDSQKMFEAGASRVIIASSKQWAIINRINHVEPPLEELLRHSKDNIDIILVEGWKFSKIKKIEVYRKVLKKEMLSSQDKSFIAIATDEKKLSISTKIPILNVNDTKQIGDFILKNLNIYNV
jgi:molybdopterin-guanine dinucleotide biosynthesis protein MobB